MKNGLGVCVAVGWLAAGSAAGQEGSYPLCVRYSHDGGCSQTMEHVSALAWLRLDLGPGGQAALALRVRSHDTLRPWGDPRPSFHVGEQLLDLRWSGTWARAGAGGEVRIELQPPTGEAWDRWQTHKGHFLPRDERPSQGMQLDCQLLPGRALACPRPEGRDSPPPGHLARLVYFLCEEGVLELPLAPGLFRERNEDTFSVRGELPGGAPTELAPPSLDAALAAARASLTGPDPTRAREAAALLAVCDPDGPATPEARTWLRAPAPSEAERKQIEEQANSSP